MVDVAVKSEAAWACGAQGRPLADVVFPVHGPEDLGRSGDADSGGPVLLEQVEEGAPCVLTLRCSPASHAAIGRLLLVSEARTMEVYDQEGAYCGTVRGAQDGAAPPHGEDRGPLYRKQLILEQPCSACEVKLLSLAGRSSVLLWRVEVGLQAARSCAAPGGGGGGGSIDLQQVQSLMEEMGASLSPGAQSLMDMVQSQQKSGALGGFLPLLMGGGAFAALARGAGAPLNATGSEPPSAVSTPSDVAPPAQNGRMSDSSSSSSSSSSSPDVPMSDVSSTPGGSESGGPVSHAHLAEMMSRLLKGHGVASEGGGGGELLPMLQSVCGQVTQLRLEEEQRSSWRALDPAMERRLDAMERRLKEHLDRRLDALEQKLERLLLLGAAPGPPAGAPPTEAGKELAATAAAH